MHSYLWDENPFTYKKILSRDLILVRVEFLLERSMNYWKLKPKIGDVVAVSPEMSLKFEKIAEDIAPVWIEVPPEPSTMQFNDGSYLNVTNDLWFVYDQGWRVMSHNEQHEAYRQTYLSEIRDQSNF
jgi:hypothetical protein